MSASAPAAAAARRAGLAFATEDDAIADVRRLRSGYAQAGNWSLAQACWHLNVAVRSRMAPGPHPANTPEQDARRPVLERVLATGALPDGLAAPDGLTPPADAGDDAVDALVSALEQFKAYAGPIAPHRLFGHLPDADARRINLIHCARHLSFLMPNTRRQGLNFPTVDAVIADVERLRKGHVAVGMWTFSQAAWHVGLAIHMCLKPVPAGVTSSPEQRAMKTTFIDPLIAAGTMQPGLPIAPGTNPVTDAGDRVDDAEVDRLLAGLRDLKAFTHDRVNFGPFGVVSADEFRAFVRIHAANHLSNFVPNVGSPT